MRSRSLLTGFAVLLLSCGRNENLSEVPCLQVTMQPDGFSSSKPSKISAFFSVETRSREPVPDLTEKNFSLLEDDNNVSDYESQKTIQPRGLKSRVSTLLLLDLSGSILRSGGLTQLKASAETFIDQIFARPQDGQRLAIYTFDGRSSIQPLVRSEERRVGKECRSR